MLGWAGGACAVRPVCSCSFSSSFPFHARARVVGSCRQQRKVVTPKMQNGKARRKVPVLSPEELQTEETQRRHGIGLSENPNCLHLSGSGVPGGRQAGSGGRLFHPPTTHPARNSTSTAHPNCPVLGHKIMQHGRQGRWQRGRLRMVAWVRKERERE